MNWQKIAIADLQSYTPRKVAIDNLRDRIAELNTRIERLGSTSNDVPVQGGGNRTEEGLINGITERDRLEMSLHIAEDLIHRIDKGLAVLSDDQRKVLDGFYINRSLNYMDKLCDELHCEKSTVYRIKDEALHKFTVAMYGIVDL